MSGKLTPFLSRTLALVLSLAVFGAGYLMVAEPLLANWRATKDQVARAAVLIERFRRVGATRPALEKQMAALRRRQSSGVGYLTGASDTIAGAALQNRVKRIGEKSGAKINSSQILPTKTENGLRRIGVKLRLEADIAALQKFLHRLESGRPLLFLDKMQVRKRRVLRRRTRRSRSRTGSTTNATTPRTVENIKLTVSLDLHGYLRAPSP